MGRLEVRTAEAEVVLSELVPEGYRSCATFGVEGDAAFLRLASQSHPGRWAVVSTPGDRWFSFEVDGGFCLDHFEEDTSDADVKIRLARYVEYAIQYIDGYGVASKRGLLGLPELELLTEEGPVRLRRSISRTILGFTRSGPDRSDHAS